MLEVLTLFAQGAQRYSETNNAMIGGGYYGFGIDYYYILLVIPAMIIALIAQARVKSAYNKYSKIPNSRGLTGAQAARMILDSHGLNYVPITMVQGQLTDNFNPTTNTVNLSPDVYSGTSIASTSCAAMPMEAMEVPPSALRRMRWDTPSSTRSIISPTRCVPRLFP